MKDDESLGCLASFIGWGGIFNAGIIGYHHGAASLLPKESEPWMLIGTPIIYGLLAYYIFSEEIEDKHSIKKAIVSTATIGTLEAIVYGVSYAAGSLTRL